MRVNGYFRKDGTYVHSYTRRAPCSTAESCPASCADSRSFAAVTRSRPRLRTVAALTLAVVGPASPALAQVATPTSPSVDGLTVYSSLPMSGGSRIQALAVSRGAALALAHSNGVAAGRPVTYISLDDATTFAGHWTPEQTAANATRAAQDASTIGYIGEFNSGATAVSLPILNVGGVPQISPTNTAIGLTRSSAGAE